MRTAVLTLVLGGARSGKSALAEHLAEGSGAPVTYVATGPPPDSDDPDWATRVAEHRARRPAAWTTVEAGGTELVEAVSAVPGTALVDSLGTWVAALGDGVDYVAVFPFVGPLVAALEARRRDGRPTVVVSEEVGLGVHPSTAVGGRFRDALGDVNRAVADVADSVLLVVAGRVVALGDRVPGADQGPAQ